MTTDVVVRLKVGVVDLGKLYFLRVRALRAARRASPHPARQRDWLTLRSFKEHRTGAISYATFLRDISFFTHLICCDVLAITFLGSISST